MHVSSSPLTPGTLFQTSKSPVVHTSVMLVNMLFKVLSSGYHHGIADGVMVLSSTLMGGVVSIHFAGFQVIALFEDVHQRPRKGRSPIQSVLLCLLLRSYSV